MNALRFLVIGFCMNAFGAISWAQGAPDPELPALTDNNRVNLTTGSLSLGHEYGSIGPQREELQQSDQFGTDGFGETWSPTTGFRARNNLEDFTIFYDEEEDTYNVASEKVKIRFSYSYQSGEFTPIGATLATLENVAGNEQFTDLIYTAENGSTYTFEAFARPAYYASQPMAGLKKIEYPNGEIFQADGSLNSGFCYSNLGYSSFPYLTNLGYTRCDVVSCSEYSPNDWPGEQHDPAPSFTLHDPSSQTVNVGGGDQVTYGPRYAYARIEYLNGDTIRANFDMNFTNGNTNAQNKYAKVISVQRHGATWLYDYADAPGSPSGIDTTTVTGPDGVKNRFQYQHDDNKIRKHEVIPSNGGTGLTTNYAYASERLISITYPEGNQTHFNRDSFGRVSEIRKEAKPGSSKPDMVTSWSYETCTSSNRKWCAKPKTYTDERGKVSKYKYSDTHGGIIETQSPYIAGEGYRKTKIEYAQFHAWYRTSSSGVQVKDNRAVWRKTKEINCVVSTEAAACSDGEANVQVTQYAYEQGNSTTPSNIKLESMTTRAGDGGLSATVQYGYDTWGRKIWEDGPLPGASDRVWYEYDKRGNVLRATYADPDGSGPQRATYTRTEYNQVDQVTLESSGWTTNYTPPRTDTSLSSVDNDYDTYGRLINSTQLDKFGGAVSVTQTSYDSSSRTDCVALRMAVSTYSSLPASACAQTNSGTDRITKTSYDAYGRAYKSTRAFGTSIAMSEETGFTLNGLTKPQKDANGNLTTYEYDGHDRLEKTRFPNKAATGSSATDYDEWTYLVENGLSTPLHDTRRYRDGKIVSYQYDALSRLTLTNAPGTQDDISQSYDVFGNLDTQTKNGQSLI